MSSVVEKSASLPRNLSQSTRISLAIVFAFIPTGPTNQYFASICNNIVLRRAAFFMHHQLCELRPGKRRRISHRLDELE